MYAALLEGRYAPTEDPSRGQDGGEQVESDNATFN